MTFNIEKVPFLALFLIISCKLHAQMPDNFEFLDHRNRSSNLGASAVVGDNIYYVSHNDLPPWTTFNVVDKENNVKTILKDSWNFSNSKLLHADDTSATIVLTELIEYDIVIPGAFVIKMNTDTVVIDSIFYGYENPLAKEITDMVIDTSGRYILSNYRELIISEDENVKEIITSDTPRKIFQNSNYDLYGYNSHEIFRFDGSVFEKQIELEDYIVDTRSDRNLNYVLTRNWDIELFKLEVFNIDFTEKINSIELLYQANSLDQFNFYEDDIHVIFSHDDLLEIMSIDSFGQFTLIHQDENLNELYSKFIPLDDTRYLLMGVYGPIIDRYGRSNFSKNIFFRNYSLIEENIYDRVYVSADNLEVDRTSSDTTQIIERQGFPTLYLGSHRYNLELDITNLGEDDISYVNIYSEDKLDGGDSKLHFDFEYEGSLSPDEKVRIKQDAQFYQDASALRDSVGIPLFIPGADFKFNRNPFLDLQILVDVNELIEDADFKVFPNPVSDVLNLSFDKPLKSILIYDLSGILRYSDRGSNISGSIDVASLPSGTYFLKAILKNSNQYLVSKFIKI